MGGSGGRGGVVSSDRGRPRIKGIEGREEGVGVGWGEREWAKRELTAESDAGAARSLKVKISIVPPSGPGSCAQRRVRKRQGKERAHQRGYNGHDGGRRKVATTEMTGAEGKSLHTHQRRGGLQKIPPLKAIRIAATSSVEAALTVAEPSWEGNTGFRGVA